MKPHWNDRIPLENPHKGWYHHYPDNHINKYIIQDDSDILDFPGMDHIYLRLSWAYLEPQEGVFHWDVIDSLIHKWTAKGLKISFRISCKETSTDRVEQQYATPKWVMEAGAQGGYYRNGEKTGPDGPWEPVFDDPVFLEKLENFLRAFSARYDGKPWVRYIDIGSIGDWGEGHTHSGSRLDYSWEQRKIHVDLYLKYFKKTLLVISDDFVYGVQDAEDRKKMHQYILDHGISYRDDSILVDWYVQTYPETFTVRSPELFEDVYRKTPTVFELEHYSSVRRNGNWFGAEGSSLRKYGKGKSGADMFRGALRLLHASYIGYHGDARVWLRENRELSDALLNRCGYWYFLHQVQTPDWLRIGEDHEITLAWENRGVAPAYYPYVIQVRLEGPGVETFEMDSGCQNWMPEPPGRIYNETYKFAVPKTPPAGRYTMKIKLYSRKEDRDVFLALDPDLMDEDHFYTISSIDVRE
ncbi:MAG: DUF4832 domain-containing protein [Candidatus Hinthialibacter sp.]